MRLIPHPLYRVPGIHDSISAGPALAEFAALPKPAPRVVSEGVPQVSLGAAYENAFWDGNESAGNAGHVGSDAVASHEKKIFDPDEMAAHAALWEQTSGKLRRFVADQRSREEQRLSAMFITDPEAYLEAVLSRLYRDEPQVFLENVIQALATNDGEAAARIQKLRHQPGKEYVAIDEILEQNEHDLTWPEGVTSKTIWVKVAELAAAHHCRLILAAEPRLQRKLLFEAYRTDHLAFVYAIEHALLTQDAALADAILGTRNGLREHILTGYASQDVVDQILAARIFGFPAPGLSEAMYAVEAVWERLRNMSAAYLHFEPGR